MKAIRFLVLVLCSVAFLAGCNAGPKGTYKLDKEAVKKAMEAEIAKKPKDEQAFAGLALALVEAMDITLEIKDGGKYEMKSSMPNLGGKGDKKEETESGDYTVEGDTITFKGGKEEMKCKFDASKIECASKKEGDPPTFFKKS
jgi:hypothetical protein